MCSCCFNLLSSGLCEISRQLKRRTSVSENTGPKRRWIVRSHIGWRCERNFFIRVWRPLHNRYVLKILKGSSKVEVLKGRYLLTVGLIMYTKRSFKYTSDLSEKLRDTNY